MQHMIYMAYMCIHAILLYIQNILRYITVLYYLILLSYSFCILLMNIYMYIVRVFMVHPMTHPPAEEPSSVAVKAVDIT